MSFECRLIAPDGALRRVNSEGFSLIPTSACRYYKCLSQGVETIVILFHPILLLMSKTRVV